MGKISKVLVVGSLLLSGSGALADSTDTEIPVIQTPPIATEPAPQTGEAETSKEAGDPQIAIAVDGEYGPTQSSVTLWAIAKQLADEQGVSAWKMQNALYKANPLAFNNNDINSLMVGVMLKVPVFSPAPVIKPKPKLKQQSATIVGDTKADNVGNPPPDLQPVAPAAIDTAQPRIEKLEQQVDSMQKLLDSKEQQLAELQRAPAVSRADDAQVSHILFISAGVVAGVLSVFGWLFWRNRPLPESDDNSPVYSRPFSDIHPKSADGSSDEFDYNFDLVSPVSVLDDDAYDPDLDDSEDEAAVESSIDLAKAYIDMGDAEAAKAALAGVLEKGTKLQQASAQALLDEIGKV